MIVASRHYIDCFFFIVSFAKKKAQSYSLEERKGRLEEEIVKINQSSNEPVTCQVAR